MDAQFQLEDWLTRCPLVARYGHYSGEIVTGPWQLINDELLRREMRDQYDWGPETPVDVFVMAADEPQDRFTTRVGGTPYWPKSRPWPRDDAGNLLLFFGAVQLH